MGGTSVSDRGANCARRTFSGGGRPRKAGPREAGGRVQRLPKEETEAEVIAIALAQPHRRGDDDPRRHWPIGRLVLDGRVKHSSLSASTLERAAQLYAADFGRWQGAVQSRRPFAVTGGKPARPEPQTPKEIEEETKAYNATLKAWANAQRALRDCGERVVHAVNYVVLDAPPSADERLLAQWIILSLPQGLYALARHYGLD